MDMDGEDCLAVPIPQITSSGGKSFNHSGVVVGPVVVEVGDEPHAAAIKIRDTTTRIEQNLFITFAPCFFYKDIHPYIGNISHAGFIFKKKINLFFRVYTFSYTGVYFFIHIPCAASTLPDYRSFCGFSPFLSAVF
jgi:hypothetical protein